MDKTNYDILIAKLDHADNINKLIVDMLCRLMTKNGIQIGSNLSRFEKYADLHSKNIERILKERYDGN